MENQLLFRTKPLYVCIDKYEKYSFTYQGWNVSDNYVLNVNSPRHSQYSICITSPIIANQEELAHYSFQGQKIADIITKLIPISGLTSLNSPKFKNFYYNQALVDYKYAPDGWESNYNSVQTSLNREYNDKMHVDITSQGFVHTSMLEQSPLLDIQHMLEHYDEVEEQIKFMLFLNDSILSANDLNVFMLIGKALEIIYQIGTYSEPKWKKDKPIKNYFPELAEILQEITFSNLLEWSNFRKESRHYVNKKGSKNIEAHVPLTKNERINLFRCTSCLNINVIRDAFKLPRKSSICWLNGV